MVDKLIKIIVPEDQADLGHKEAILGWVVLSMGVALTLVNSSPDIPTSITKAAVVILGLSIIYRGFHHIHEDSKNHPRDLD